MRVFASVTVCVGQWHPRKPSREPGTFKIHQRGVQWKQGVEMCMMLYTSLLYNTTPIHCTPLRLHPPLMTTQTRLARFFESETIFLASHSVWISSFIAIVLRFFIWGFLIC